MKKSILLLILSFLLMSCIDSNRIAKKYNELTKAKTEKHYNSSHKLQKTIEYYKGKPNNPYRAFINKKYYDSLIYYYESGSIFKKGKITKDSIAVGLWEYYDKNGNLREVRDYILFNENIVLNKVEFYNSNGDLIGKRPNEIIFEQKQYYYDTLDVKNTNFTYISFNKDTVELNRPIKALALYDTRYYSHLNSEARVFVQKYDYKDLIFDFSNITKNKSNVFFNLEKDTINRKYLVNIEPEDYKYTVPFGVYFEKPGKKVIRGYVEEYAISPQKKTDTLTVKTYFEKYIFVKDTLEK